MSDDWDDDEGDDFLAAVDELVAQHQSKVGGRCCASRRPLPHISLLRLERPLLPPLQGPRLTQQPDSPNARQAGAAAASAWPQQQPQQAGQPPQHQLPPYRQQQQQAGQQGQPPALMLQHTQRPSQHPVGGAPPGPPLPQQQPQQQVHPAFPGTAGPTPPLPAPGGLANGSAPAAAAFPQGRVSAAAAELRAHPAGGAGAGPAGMAAGGVAPADAQHQLAQLLQERDRYCRVPISSALAVPWRCSLQHAG